MENKEIVRLGDYSKEKKRKKGRKEGRKVGPSSPSHGLDWNFLQKQSFIALKVRYMPLLGCV